ncbi:MAG: hypothetical protein AVDCRST_MAG59-5199, partial [uncultured Thermomicrobiales bacterium]
GRRARLRTIGGRLRREPTDPPGRYRGAHRGRRSRSHLPRAGGRVRHGQLRRRLGGNRPLRRDRRRAVGSHAGARRRAGRRDRAPTGPGRGVAVRRRGVRPRLLGRRDPPRRRPGGVLPGGVPGAGCGRQGLHRDRLRGRHPSPGSAVEPLPRDGHRGVGALSGHRNAPHRDRGGRVRRHRRSESGDRLSADRRRRVPGPGLFFAPPDRRRRLAARDASTGSGVDSGTDRGAVALHAALGRKASLVVRLRM